MTLDHLKSVNIDAVNGIKQFNFEAVEPSTGAVSRATIAVDKYGQILGQSSTKFRGFTDMIARNTVKVVEWAVAVGLVYGVMRKMSEAFQTLVDFNESMSNVQLSTGEATDAVVIFFDSAAEAARRSGTDLTGVLDIYDDALRATRSMGDASQRFAAAENLVSNALVFARLTGKDAKSATDDLVASLRQVAEPGENSAKAFARAGELLDTWTYAAYRAQISMEDMAETFSITGSAAREAGVDINTLSAMASVLSESTSKSAAEVGNTIRRLIGQTESDTGVKALNRYAIAIEDITGKAKDWDDVMTEIAVKYRAGVLSAKALRDIAYAIGGGPRGSADFITMIKSWNDVMTRSADIAANKNGAALAALAIKSKTLKSAINELSTAFSTLVIKMGTEGGLISALTSAVKLMTTLTDLVGGLTAKMGPATAKIGAMVLAFSLLARYGPFLQGKLFSGALGSLALGGLQGLQGIGQTLGKPGLFAGTIAQVQAARPPTQAPQPYLNRFTPGLGAVMTGALALSELGTENAGWKIGATIGGALVSTALGGGPIVGAAIGNAVMNIISQRWEENKLLAKEPTGLTDVELQQQYNLARSRVLESMNLGPFMPSYFQEAIASKVEEIFANQGAEAARAFIKSMYQTLPTEMAKEAPIQSFLLFGEGGKPSQAELDAELRNLESMIAASGAMKGRNIKTPEQQQILDKLATERLRQIGAWTQQLQTGPFIKESEKRRQAAALRLSGGEKGFGPSDYKSLVAGIDATTNQAGILFAELEGLSSDNLEKVAENFAGMSEESRTELMDLATRISETRDNLATFGTVTDENRAKFKELGIAFKNDTADLKLLYEYFKKFQIDMAAFQFTGFQDLSDMTAAQIEEAHAGALKLQQNFIDTMGKTLGFTEDEFKSTIESMVYLFAGGFGQMTDIHQAFWTANLQKWQESQKSLKQFNLERLKDIKPEQFGDLQNRVNKWQNFLSGIPGFNEANPKQTFNLLLGDDPTWKRIITTQEALRYAIEELTAIEKKQLEGQWNIPEGATVMVPLTSLYYKGKVTTGGPFGTYAGGETLPTVPTELPGIKSLDTSAQNTAGSMNMLDAAIYGTTQGFLRLGSGEFPKQPLPLESPGFLRIGGGEFPAGRAQGDIFQRGSEFAMQFQKSTSDITTISGNLQRAATALENAHVTVYNTVVLDGKVIQRYVSQQMTRNLSRSIRSSGEASGGVI